MTRKLIQKRIDDKIVYVWLEDDVTISPPGGHDTLADAEKWIVLYTNYHGPENRWRPAERRWSDRRKRTSYLDRRNGAGRRYADQIRSYKNRGLK